MSPELHNGPATPSLKESKFPKELRNIYVPPRAQPKSADGALIDDAKVAQLVQAAKQLEPGATVERTSTWSGSMSAGVFGGSYSNQYQITISRVPSGGYTVSIGTSKNVAGGAMPSTPWLAVSLSGLGGGTTWSENYSCKTTEDIQKVLQKYAGHGLTKGSWQRGEMMTSIQDSNGVSFVGSITPVLSTFIGGAITHQDNRSIGLVVGGTQERPELSLSIMIEDTTTSSANPDPAQQYSSNSNKRLNVKIPLNVLPNVTRDRLESLINRGRWGDLAKIVSLPNSLNTQCHINTVETTTQMGPGKTRGENAGRIETIMTPCLDRPLYEVVPKLIASQVAKKATPLLPRMINPVTYIADLFTDIATPSVYAKRVVESSSFRGTHANLQFTTPVPSAGIEGSTFFYSPPVRREYAQ